MSIPLVSIVIPIYNAEKTIKRCLKSIKKQTYSNYEVVCVNDGTKDNSVNIIETNFATDDRFKVINQDNQGAFQARRKGILNAKGKYILFLDADDVLPNPKSIQTLINYMKNDRDLQLIQFSSESVYKLGFSKRNFGADLGKISKVEFFEKYAHELMTSIPKTAISVAIWDKFYRTDILKEIVEKNTDISIPIGEDLYLNLLYLDHCKVENILITSDVFYSYYQGIGVMAHGDPWKGIIGYQELKQLQLHLCGKWGLDNNALYNCHAEVIYYLLSIVIGEFYNNKKTDSFIIDKLAYLNKLPHLIEAKKCIAGRKDKLYPEMEVLISASPQEYLNYIKNNRSKPDGPVKRRIKALLKLK